MKLYGAYCIVILLNVYFVCRLLEDSWSVHGLQVESLEAPHGLHGLHGLHVDCSHTLAGLYPDFSRSIWSVAGLYQESSRSQAGGSTDYVDS